MNIGVVARLSKIDRLLYWWDTSLIFNWLLIPLFVASLWGYLNLGDRIGIAEAARSAKPTQISGELDRGGYRNRDLILVSPEGKRTTLTCGAYYYDTACIPAIWRNRIPLDVDIEVFKYKNEPVLLAARDQTGKTIVSRATRQLELDSIDENARDSTWDVNFLMGFMFGVILAAGRYVLFVWRARRRVKKMTVANARN